MRISLRGATARRSWPTLAQLAVVVVLWASVIVPTMASGTSYSDSPPPPPTPSTPDRVGGQTSPTPPNPSTTPDRAGGLKSPPPPAMSKPRRQVWNITLLKASDFRNNDVPPRFKLWPENLSYVKLSYFCEQSPDQPKYSLMNFTYEVNEGILVPRPYFDVGWVDEQYTPYFKHWRLWQVNLRRLVCPVKCEYSDLQLLYGYRLRHKVLGKGTVYGVAAVAILQLAVAVFITLMRIVPGKVRRDLAATEGSTFLGFWWNWSKEMEWSDCASDWMHLVLLVLVGFSMMEAVGHSDYFEWRSMLFYNTGVAYTYLTFLAMVSSCLQQCDHFLMLHRRVGTLPLPSPSPRPAPPLSRVHSRAVSSKYSEKPPVDSVYGSGDDWKYQRIFGQFGVLVLMVVYLTSVDDDEEKGMDNLGGIVVAAIVVACIWSGGVSTICGFRSARSIFSVLRPEKLQKVHPAA